MKKNIEVTFCIQISSNRGCLTWSDSATQKGKEHRRRIYTDEKAKVVASVWGTEFIQFLTTLAQYFAPG